MRSLTTQELQFIADLYLLSLPDRERQQFQQVVILPLGQALPVINQVLSC
ncbi:hypothetical protein H6F43_03820 [Leptolyngbya sp. FACHB-36]|nr:hypothetical protein [Leptolyngbya sp. FACHB-36]MBD2019310.1 hypothetical protein [Leptolyngbya sp. FACHB-36]